MNSKSKKFLSLLLVLSMLSVLVLGCAKTEEPIEEEKEDVVGEVETDNLSTDVVVIGAGGGGLAAALEAKSAGSDVIVVEKMTIVGGNTLRATGGLNAAGTSVQKELGIEDTPEVHYEDTMKGGDEKNDPELVKTLTDNAADTVEWLIGIGADLTDVGRLGGASNDRAHRPTGGSAVGPHLVEVLKSNAEKEGIDIMLDTTATEILYEDGKVNGIKATDKEGNEFTIDAKAVVLATGGFGANSDMVVEYKSDLKGFGTTNHLGATGDGITMAMAIGADTTQMDEIQTHPTVVPDNGYMITEAVRGNGALLINREGKRFTDEIGRRDVVSEAILDQEGQSAFLVFDDTIRESLAAIDGYIKKGFTTEGETVEELAEALGIDPVALNETIEAYNGFVDAGTDGDFQRADMPRKLERAKYYAIEIAPAVHHTMGGLKINTEAEVLDTAGTIMGGLYGAGEVTGGVHGGNRLGGNALADIITYGRIAGKNAASFAK